MENLIQSYIDGHRSEMVDLWKEIVNTESGTRQLDGVNAVGAILTRELEQAGAVVHRVSVKNVGEMIVGDWNRGVGRAPIVFMGHMDTVFPAGEAERNPFRIDGEGFAHGPGVTDMKAGLVIGGVCPEGTGSPPAGKSVLSGSSGVPDEENLHMLSNAKELIPGRPRSPGRLQL